MYRISRIRIGIFFLSTLFVNLAAQTPTKIYKGTLYKQEVKIFTHTRCAPDGAIASDTVKSVLPLNSSEIDLKTTFCNYADFTGKLTFQVPSEITANLKDDSVLVFQSPAKADISVSYSGTGTQKMLIDTLSHYNFIQVQYAPGVGSLTDEWAKKCDLLSAMGSNGIIPKKIGTFNLSANAECNGLDFLVAYPDPVNRNPDTLYTLILISGQTHLTQNINWVADYLLYDRVTSKACFIWAIYKFVRQGTALEGIGVWQDITVQSEPRAFSNNKSDLLAEFDGVKADIITATLDSISVRVPPELVGDRANVQVIPNQNPREVELVVKINRQNAWVEVARRRYRFNPPRPLLYDEVTRSNPPLVQSVVNRLGPRWRQSFIFLGRDLDGTAAVRILNTSTKMTPLTLYGKVISPPRPPVSPTGELFDKSNDPNFGNMINLGIANAGIQFPVSQNGWYVIVVEPKRMGITGGSAGPIPSMYQIHLAGNAGLPRKIINGVAEPPRAIQLDTYFNHPAPRTETLVNAGPGLGSFAETALFKFANPVSTSPFAVAVLIPPFGSPNGFPFRVAPVRAPGPAGIGLFPSGAIDPTTPMAQSPAVLNAMPGTVLDMAQVPIPASVVAVGPPGGVAAILGKNDGNNLTLPYQGISTVIVDMGSGQEIVDADGADLRIIGTGNFIVAVSQTPFALTFVNVVSGTGTKDYDLAGSGLTGCRYVRITAVGTASIDAVQGLNFLSDRFESYGPVSDVTSTTITMRRDKAPTNMLDPMLELIAPDGSSWGKNESSFGDDTSPDKSDAMLINKDLSQNGFYRFLGRGYDTQPDEQAFGTFYTRLETGGNFDPVELTVSQENETNTVAQKRGTISAFRQRDSYLFQATPGSVVRMVVNGIESPSLPDPLIELYDPEDFFIAANDDYNGRGKRAALELTLPTFGRSGAQLPSPSTYRIVVIGVDGRSTNSTTSSGSRVWERKVNSGRYELKVFTGAFEGNTQVLQPQIFGVTPNIIAAGAVDQVLTLSGQNFTTDAVLSFSRDGITIKSLQRINATELEAVINVAQNASLGSYDVIVTQSQNLKATATNALTIKASLGKIALTWLAPSNTTSINPPSNLTAVYSTTLARTMSKGSSSLLRSSFINSSALFTTVIEREPNNSPDEAQTLPADSVVIVNGQAEVDDKGYFEMLVDEFAVDDVEDFFKIQTTAPGLAIVLTNIERDCDLYLFDEQGNWVDASIEAGDTTPEFLVLSDLPAGVYYAGVSIYDPDFWTNDSTKYQLEIYTEMSKATQSTLKGFAVYRSSRPDAKNSGKRIALVSAATLQYSDPVLANGTWYYQITAEYDSGESQPSNEAHSFATKVTMIKTTPPTEFVLYQNHPNPFNPSTTLQFKIPEPMSVRLFVFDVVGKQQALLFNKFLPAGEYSVAWKPTDLPSGIYLARLQGDHFIRQIKMMYVK